MIWNPANNAIFWTDLQALMGMRTLIDGPHKPTIFGDSIVGYMTPHWSGLGPCNKPFANIGFPGAMLQDLLDYALNLIPALKPCSAVIAIGINNALDAQNSRPADFLGGLGTIIPAIRAYTQKVALATILPMEQGLTQIAVAANIQPFIQGINAIIRQAAINEVMPLIDTNEAFAGPDGYACPGYTVDGVHPSAAGFAALKPLYDCFVGAGT